MANKKISELTTLGDSGEAVLIETVRNGANFKMLHNLQATAIPTVTNDSSEGYCVGSLWNFGGVMYSATDVSIGAAVWVQVGGISSGTYTPTVSGVLNGGNVTFDVDNRYVNSNGSISVKGRILVELEASNTEEQFDFDLASLIEPSSNFSDAFDVIGCVVPTTAFSIGNIYALTGSKKIQVLVKCDSAGEPLKFYFDATYFI